MIKPRRVKLHLIEKNLARREKEKTEEERQRLYQFFVCSSLSLPFSLSLDWSSLRLSSSVDLSCPTSCSLFRAGRSFAVVNGVATTCR